MDRSVQSAVRMGWRAVTQDLLKSGGRKLSNARILQGATVLPVAQECQLRKIPFVVITGYGRLPLDEPLLNDAVRVRKPFNKNDIAKALATLMESGAAAGPHS
jgi:hypothetical protein